MSKISEILLGGWDFQGLDGPSNKRELELTVPVPLMRASFRDVALRFQLINSSNVPQNSTLSFKVAARDTPQHVLELYSGHNASLAAAISGGGDGA